MKQSTYRITEMDCPSEERMIRMRLDAFEDVVRLEFDLSTRRLDVFHRGADDEIDAALDGLSLGAERVGRVEGVDAAPAGEDDAVNRGPLLAALGINLGLFGVELIAGLIAGSMGLVADGLDMLADAFVYGLSLYAVGRAAGTKRRLAAASGYLQGGLAGLGLVEVVRRFVGAADVPQVGAMVAVSLLALAGNVATLLVLRRTKRGEAHIEASWIFTSNDIKVNALVIVAGGLVAWSGSRLPDLVVGGLIFVIVAQGARRILALARG